MESMRVSEWLDQQEADNVDVSEIDPPADLMYDDQPDETIYFVELNPCGIFCKGNHPFSTVERYGDWFYGRGQDSEAGLHSSGMKWKLFTRDKSLALSTAKAHIE
jgi:hypothetical protein